MRSVSGIMLILALFVNTASAQDSKEKTMEKRAREMVRVISLSDKEMWKTFIRDNYTKALIDRPMQAKVATSNDKQSTTSAETTEGNIDSKAGIFARLHDDFGGSKVKSIEIKGDLLTMVVDSGEMIGTFSLTFTAAKPWLIDKLGIEVGGDVRR